MKKRLLATFLIVSIISGCNTTTYNDYTEGTEQEQIVETETEEVIIEEVIIETEVVEETKYYYNVPLSHELQDVIFEECEKHSIAPQIIIAMIKCESTFDASDIGDSGRSFGLMQIQPRWHSGLMEQLGCNDLLDPFQNVIVGINIVAYYRAMNSDLYWVLMAYNGGPSYATEHLNNNEISDYVKDVTSYASAIQLEYDAQFKKQ